MLPLFNVLFYYSSYEVREDRLTIKICCRHELLKKNKNLSIRRIGQRRGKVKDKDWSKTGTD